MKLVLASLAAVAASSIVMNAPANALDNSETLQLLFPENNSSTQYIVELRARDGFPGHAFVAIGRKLDNGLVYYEAAAGFYPSEDESKLQSLKNLARGPGIVTLKFDDLNSDVVASVPVTQEQAANVAKRIESFDGQTYDLLENNCIQLVQAVAADLGLDPSAPRTPFEAVKYLKAKQEQRSVEKEKAPQARSTNAKEAEKARVADASRRQMEAQRAAEQTMRQVEEARRVVQQAEEARRASEAAEQARKSAEAAENARRAAEAARAAEHWRNAPVVIPPY